MKLALTVSSTGASTTFDGLIRARYVNRVDAGLLRNEIDAREVLIDDGGRRGYLPRAEKHHRLNLRVRR